jgi:hypothetical protein
MKKIRDFIGTGILLVSALVFGTCNSVGDSIKKDLVPAYHYEVGGLSNDARLYLIDHSKDPVAGQYDYIKEHPVDSSTVTAEVSVKSNLSLDNIRNELDTKLSTISREAFLTILSTKGVNLTTYQDGGNWYYVYTYKVMVEKTVTSYSYETDSLSSDARLYLIDHPNETAAVRYDFIKAHPAASSTISARTGFTLENVRYVLDTKLSVISREAFITVLSAKGSNLTTYQDGENWYYIYVVKE